MLTARDATPIDSMAQELRSRPVQNPLQIDRAVCADLALCLIHVCATATYRALKGHSRTLGHWSVSRSDQDRPDLAEKPGRRTSIRPPWQHDYCVVVADTVAGAFA